MPVGQRLVDKYIKHPPAASGWLPDGAPLDSGTAHILHSNVSHLCARNVRPLGHAIGVGPVTLASTFTAPWLEAYEDTFDPTATILSNPFGLIPWMRPANALNFGPVALAHGRLGTSPAGYYPRRVRVIVQAYKSNELNTDLVVMAALVTGGDTPLRGARIAEDHERTLSINPGARFVDMMLDCQAPVRLPNAEWTSRPNATNAPATTSLVAAEVWVGWYSTTGATPDRIESVSVNEVWED